MVRRTIKETLEEFRSVRIPLNYIFDVFPPLRAREFSIASSVKVYAFVRPLSNNELRRILEPSEGNTPLCCHGELQDSAESPTERSMYDLLVNPDPR